MNPEQIAALSALLVAVIGALFAGANNILKQTLNKRNSTPELNELKNEVENHWQIQKEIDLMLCRRELMLIYFENKKEKSINEKELETFLNIYTIYKSLGGNGLITELKEEVLQWNKK